MSALLNRLAYLQTRRDRTPNLDLARDLAAREDTAGIREIAENMWNENKNIHSDCAHVMYELGRIDPMFIMPYAQDFIKLLKSKHSDMVSSAMTSLSEIAKVDADFIFNNVEAIKKAKDTGSEAIVEKLIIALAYAASASEGYNKTIFPDLLEQISNCRPSDVPEYAELALPAINEYNKAGFIKALKKRNDDLSGAAYTRLAKIIRLAEKI